MHIAIVGSGYVGLVTGVCLADMGHQVILVDNDEAKLAALQRGEVPIHEKFLPELLARHRDALLRFSGDLAASARDSDAVFIAVGTPPTEQGDADLSYVESVARDVSGSISSYKLVVEKSTVPVYTSGWIRKIMLRNGAKADSFDVASNPEFLREGTAVTDFLYPDRIVAGSDTLRSSEVLRQIYEPLTSGRYYSESHAVPRPEGARAQLPQLMLTSAKSAELIKHASNAFLAMKISFANAVASVCESVGADAKQVCQGMGMDSRIGPRFLNPGIGYGGSCFPKDLLAFRSVARECGLDCGLCGGSALPCSASPSKEARMTSANLPRSSLYRRSCKKVHRLSPTIPPRCHERRKFCRRPSPTQRILTTLLEAQMRFSS